MKAEVTSDKGQVTSPAECTVSGEALRSDDQGLRPFPRSLSSFGAADIFKLDGRGWCSPELSMLLRDFTDAMVRQACDELGIDARRSNVAALRRHLEAQEARMK